MYSLTENAAKNFSHSLTESLLMISGFLKTDEENLVTNFCKK